MRADSRRFSFGPGIVLSIGGQETAIRQFEREYGVAGRSTTSELEHVAVEFEGHVGVGEHEVILNGRHKTAHWRVALGDPTEQPLRAWIAVTGRPLSFALSLVQGFFVEPLVAVAAARRGHVLLPAAGIEQDGGVAVLMGRSRSGKSSLSARALASGKVVLGDDQVLADACGCCWAFPRRIRVYADVAKTAPDAYARLPLLTRAAIAGRRSVSALTGGHVSPPVLIPFEAVGKETILTALPIARVVVIERSGTASAVQTATLEVEAALSYARELLDAQRAHMRTTPDAAWRKTLHETLDEEESILRNTFQRIPLARVVVPERWGAPLAVSRLEDALASVG